MNNEIALGKMTVLGTRGTQILLCKVERLQIKTGLQSPKTFHFQEPRRIDRSRNCTTCWVKFQKWYTVFVPKIENQERIGVGGQDTRGEGAWVRLTAPVTSTIFKDGSTAQISQRSSGNNPTVSAPLYSLRCWWQEQEALGFPVRDTKASNREKAEERRPSPWASHFWPLQITESRR